MRGSSTVVLSSLIVAAGAVVGPALAQPAAPDTAAPKAPAKAAPKKAPAKQPAKAKPGDAKPADAKPADTASEDGKGTTGAKVEGTPPAADAPPPSVGKADAPDLAAIRPEDMPTAVRMRRLEQKTQALKERSWQLKARVQMLKEQVLGGGVGAQTVIAHASDMGASFRLTKLIYALDGTQVFVRSDDAAESLYKTKRFDVFAGPISPGNHNLAAIATYRGHGYGVFEYLSKYTFTARGSQTFTAGEGKIARVDCRGFEKGGPTTPLEKRAAIECKVTQVQPERAPEAEPAAPTPSSAPVPAGSAPTPSSAPVPAGSAPTTPSTQPPPPAATTPAATGGN